jgi:hypothetical protein
LKLNKSGEGARATPMLTPFLKPISLRRKDVSTIGEIEEAKEQSDGMANDEDYHKKSG